jgi:hypothetical protein
MICTFGYVLIQQHISGNTMKSSLTSSNSYQIFHSIFYNIAISSKDNGAGICRDMTIAAAVIDDCYVQCCSVLDGHGGGFYLAINISSINRSIGFDCLSFCNEDNGGQFFYYSHNGNSKGLIFSFSSCSILRSSPIQTQQAFNIKERDTSGSIYIKGNSKKAEMKMEEVNFTDNFIDRSGSLGIYEEFYECSIEKCSFIRCYSGGSSEGGLMEFKDGIFTFTDCNFMNCSHFNHSSKVSIFYVNENSICAFTNVYFNGLTDPYIFYGKGSIFSFMNVHQFNCSGDIRADSISGNIISPFFSTLCDLKIILNYFSTKTPCKPSAFNFCKIQVFLNRSLIQS